MGIEPMTSPLPRECSTTELREPFPAQAPEALGPKTLSPNPNPGRPKPPQYPHGESNPGLRAENASS